MANGIPFAARKMWPFALLYTERPADHYFPDLLPVRRPVATDPRLPARQRPQGRPVEGAPPHDRRHPLDLVRRGEGEGTAPGPSEQGTTFQAVAEDSRPLPTGGSV